MFVGEEAMSGGIEMGSSAAALAYIRLSSAIISATSGVIGHMSFPPRGPGHTRKYADNGYKSVDATTIDPKGRYPCAAERCSSSRTVSRTNTAVREHTCKRRSTSARPRSSRFPRSASKLRTIEQPRQKNAGPSLSVLPRGCATFRVVPVYGSFQRQAGISVVVMSTGFIVTVPFYLLRDYCVAKSLQRASRGGCGRSA